MEIKKILLTIGIIAMSISMVYAEKPPFELPSYVEEEKLGEKLEFNVEAAVAYGLENNPNIMILDNKIDLAMITKRNAKDNADDLKDAKDRLNEADTELRSKRRELKNAKSKLDQAMTLLAAGITPVEVPLVDGHGDKITNPEGVQIVLPPGTDIVMALKVIMPEESAILMTSAIVENITSGLNDSQALINENKVALEEAGTTLSLKRNEFDNVLKDVSEKIDTKINYSSIIKLNVREVSELMITMAGVNLDVTRYAKKIYRNQIAMLIQKNYYDALLAEKICNLKEVAKERGEKQYNIVKLSYENGMKAKDDLLLSKMYYDSTIISYSLAKANYNNAIFDLRMNMNFNKDGEILLEDLLVNNVTIGNLDIFLASGLTKRIEIQQALGKLAIYELNEEIMKARGKSWKRIDNYKEAVLLRDGAVHELENVKSRVKAEINKSYELVKATTEMLRASNDLIKNAEEVVLIATIKYEQGLGASNALLNGLNLQASSGTIIELIAAQENLASVEAQVANIRYNYIMAKIKYCNDSGILIY